MKEGVEESRNAIERHRIRRHVPERVSETAVPKVAAQEQKVMAERGTLSAPSGDQSRRHGVPKIVDTRSGSSAGGHEVAGECAEGAMDCSCAESAPASAQEEAIG